MLAVAYLALSLGLVLPTVTALVQHRIPSSLAAYLLGLAVFYSIPFLTRGIAPFQGSYTAYESSLVALVSFCAVLLSVYVIVHLAIGRHQQETNARPQSSVGRRLLSLLRIVLLSVGPMMILGTLIIKNGAGNILSAFLTHGNDAVRAYLSTVGPLVILLYPVNGALIYLVAHYRKARPGFLVAVLTGLIWMATVFLTGERHMVVLVLALVGLLAVTEKRWLKVILVGFLIVTFALGYTALFKSSARAGVSSMGTVRYVWSHSIDRLWTLAWLFDGASPSMTSSAIMPALEGWKHAALAYIPRSLFPGKGYDTTQYLALAAARSIGVAPGGSWVGEIGWGIAVGGPIEGLLNFGYLGVILEALAWGVLLAVLDARQARRTDPALKSLLFLIVILSTQTTAFTQVTLFASTILGYLVVRSYFEGRSGKEAVRWLG